MRVSKSMAVLVVAMAAVGLVAGGCKGAPSAPTMPPAVQESAERAFAREFFRAGRLNQDPALEWNMMSPGRREYEYRDLIRNFGENARAEYVVRQQRDFPRFEMPQDLTIKEWHAKQTQAWTFLFETAELPYHPGYVIVVVRDPQGSLMVTDAHSYKPGERLP